MAEKILVTGSTGFIGSHLVSFLLNKKYSVVGFNSTHGDIASVKLNLPDIDRVIHLAGRSFVPESWKHPEEFMRVNVEGTRNILEYCRKRNTPLLFMSSYVYGNPVRLPIDESHPVQPPNPYAQSKREAELLCLHYAEKYDLPVTILRPFNIFGKGQPEHFLISKIIRQSLDVSYDHIELMDLIPRRDYLYVDDMIGAIFLLLQKRSKGIFNIGSGYSLSVQEIADIILRKTKSKKKIISLHESRPNEIPDVVADISKICQETGWKPSTSFERGIEHVLAAEKN